jgi:oligoribonuclease (3'-5' exoribonuclease)
MTGLDVEVDELVEVAVVITDFDLKPIDPGSPSSSSPTRPRSTA